MAKYDYLNNYLNGNMNQYKGGGMLNRYDVGGTHEQNPNGGIPIGGKSSVEQGESSVNIDENGNTTEKPTGKKYIYSDRQMWTPEEIKSAGLPPIRGKAMTASAYMKKLDDKFEGRGGAKDAQNTLQDFHKRAQGLAEQKRMTEQAQLQAAMQANTQQVPEDLPTEVPQGMEEYQEQPPQMFMGGNFSRSEAGNLTGGASGIASTMPNARVNFACGGMIKRYDDGGNWYDNNNSYASVAPGQVFGPQNQASQSTSNMSMPSIGNIASSLGTGMSLYGMAKGNTSRNKFMSAGVGAVQGALEGSKYGMIPGIVGGVTGLGAGLLGANKAEKNYQNELNSAISTANAGMPNAQAWSAYGGYINRYDEGGMLDRRKPPLYVDSKNDPRYKAYQDSLLLHNFYKNPNPKDYEKVDIATNRLTRLNNKQPEQIKTTHHTGINQIGRPVQNAISYGFKKPQQPVLIGRDTPQVEQLNTISPRGIQTGIQPPSGQTPLSNMHPYTPSHYDVTDITSGYGGGESRYQAPSLEGLRDLGPGNTRTSKPVYAMGGYINRQPAKYADGGTIDPDEYNTAMRGMMKSKIGIGNALGNPAIKRMSQAMPKTGMTPEGLGTHYVSSMGEYAVPLLQDRGGKNLMYNENPKPSSEDIRFNRPQDAQYFAEHYKEVAPMSTIYKGLQEYGSGGTIHIKPENRGKFNATKARTGKSTEELTHSSNPLTRKRAVFAQNARKWHHDAGGPLDTEPPFNMFKPTNTIPQVGSTGINPNIPLISNINKGNDNAYWAAQADKSIASQPEQSTVNKYSDYFNKYGKQAGDYLKENAPNLMRMSPVVSNFLQRESITRPTGTNYARLNDTFNVPQVDEATGMRDVNQLYNTQRRAIGQMGGSQAQQRAMLSGLGNQQTEAVSKYAQSAAQQNRELALQKQQYQNSIAQYNANAQDRNTEAYRADIGNYDTQKSKFTGQIGTDLGEIGKEQLHMKQVAAMYGYTWDGKYMRHPKTGEIIDPATISKATTSVETPGITATQTTIKAFGGYLTRKPSKY